MGSTRRWSPESPGRRRTGRGRGLIPRGNRDSGTGAGPRAALDPPGLGRDSGWPAPCPLGSRRLRPGSSRAFRSCLSLTEARDAVGQTDQKARPCVVLRRGALGGLSAQRIWGQNCRGQGSPWREQLSRNLGSPPWQSCPLRTKAPHCSQLKTVSSIKNCKLVPDAFFCLQQGRTTAFHTVLKSQ